MSGAIGSDFSAEIMAKSLSIAIPDWVKGASGPIDAKVHVEGKEAKVDLVRTVWFGKDSCRWRLRIPELVALFLQD